MQHLHVEGIHDVVVHVQPAVRHHGKRSITGGAEAADTHPHLFLGRDLLEIVVQRQNRTFLRRPEIGEDQAIALFDRIPRLARVVAVAPAVGLTRLVQTTTLSIEQPTVIATANAFGLDAPVVKGCPPMHTAWIEQTGAPAAIAEQHEILTENSDFARQIANLCGGGNRMPVAAHQLAAGRAGSDLDQRFVAMGLRSAVGATVA